MKTLDNFIESTENINGNSLEIKRDDSLSRAVSYVGCLPTKLVMLSDRMGKYPEEETQGYIRNYLKNSGLKGVKVRVGHTRILKDTLRLFTDKNLKDISLAGRILLGIPTTLFGGLYAKLSRADNYNPFTKTATIYSDIPAVALHELGHAEDYANTENPSLYALSRVLYPLSLYQEVQASKIAHKNISEDKQWQTGRYLVPAFATYVSGPLILPFLPVVAAGHLIGNTYALYNIVSKKIKNFFRGNK